MSQSPENVTSGSAGNAQAEFDRQSLSGLDRRLSILEERTQPKPKPLVERITAWGGVATFILAVLYTFPLGVWDRFFVSPVTEVRSLIVELTDVDAETFRTSQRLPMEQFLSVNMAMRAKKTALLQAHRDLILSEQDVLSPAEVELLGYHAASVGDFDLATKLYDSALSKIGAEGPLSQPVLLALKADIYRLQAGLLVWQSPSANLGKARERYLEALKIYRSLDPTQFTYPTAMVVWEWATFEHSMGSRACAHLLAQSAIQIISPVDPQRAQSWLSLFQQVESSEVAIGPMTCDDKEILAITKPSLGMPVTVPALSPR